jgi:collagenase-like PrtC family protease
MHMTTKSKKEKFGWRCGYEKIYGGFHADNERCTSACRKKYDSLDDAIRAALQHKTHRSSVYVYSTKTGYIGLAEGLNFNK